MKAAMKFFELAGRLLSAVAALRGRVAGRLRDTRHGEEALASFERNPLLWTMVACVAAFLVWAAFFTLDVASYASGQVIPAGQLKRIQHLEGGIVRNIAVSEGQPVKAGMVIADLEDVAPDAEAGDMKGRAGTLEIRIARLTALLNNKTSLAIDPALSRDFPEFARESVSAFESARQRYTAMLQTYESKASQRRAEIQELKERLIGLESRRKYINQQVGISEQMLKQKLTNEYDHLQLQKEQAQVQADLNGTVAGKRRAEVALEEAIAELAAFRHQEEVSLRKELQDASIELASLKERLKKPNDSQERTSVRAPVDGTIMTLYVKNKGAVVSPGGTLATLVPAGEELLIEAKLPISEVGYVQIGALARLSIASGGNGFSAIDAKVVHISPDAVTEENKGSYYIVRLAPGELLFRRGKDTYPLRPGVQVTAAIISGERSVLALLLEPFLGSGVHPLTER